MKWLRQHKMDAHYQRTSIPRNHKTAKTSTNQKHSLSYSSYQIPSDKIDTPIRIFAADGSAQQRVLEKTIRS